MAALCSDVSGDESESSSTSYTLDADNYGDASALAPEVESQLEHFRRQWHAEIHGRAGEHRIRRTSGENRRRVADAKAKQSANLGKHENAASSGEAQNESVAQDLWLRGADAERNHDLLSAVQCYRKALQLVPDIEKRMNVAQKQPVAVTENIPKVGISESSLKDAGIVGNDERKHIDHADEAGNDTAGDDDSNLPLMTRIRRALDEQVLNGEPLVQLGEHPLAQTVEYTQGVEATEPSQAAQVTSVHIGDLPVELLLTILSYVVGPDLDARSLEQCAAVCRGFYLLARDDDVWRLICARLCGASNAVRFVLKLNASCWRDLYMHVPHLFFNGVYLSRTSYVRYGQPDFSRQYTPFYLVEYYRCMRFLPDGVVVMVTSADEPAALVRLLRSVNVASLRATRPAGVLFGKYRVAYDEFDCNSSTDPDARSVKLYMHMNGVSSAAPASTASASVTSRQFGTNWSNTVKAPFSNKSSSVQSDPPTSFRMEMMIGGKHHRRLKWLRYFVTQHVGWGPPNTSELRITDEQYPPFYFSRVKSFTSESLGCLK